MCTRFHALGFACEWSQDEAQEIARLAASAKREIAVKGGFYRVHRASSGFELWFHYVNRRDAAGREVKADGSDFNAVKGMTPFHGGDGRLEMVVHAASRFDRGNPLTGAYLVSPPVKGGGKASRQFTIEMVPFSAHPPVTQSITRWGQIVCFASVVTAHETADHYVRSTPEIRRLPIGAIRPAGGDDLKALRLPQRQRVLGVGLLVGTVVRSVRLTNPIARAPYYWLVVATETGHVDVIANPSTIKGDISVGAIADVCGSMVGRLDGVM